MAPPSPVVWTVLLAACEPFGGAWHPLTEVEVTVEDPSLGDTLVLTVDGVEGARVVLDGDHATVPLPEVETEVEAWVGQVNGDGVHVGASLHRLHHYVDERDEFEVGVLDPDIDHGVGWAVATDGMSMGLLVADEQSLELSALPMSPGVTVAGTLEPADVAGRGLALLPYSWFADGGEVPETLVDQPATERWSLTLAAPPPDAHLETLVGDGYEVYYFPVTGAAERLVLYADPEGDGFSAADEVLRVGCVDHDEYVLTWLPPPVDVADAVAILRTRLDVGWGLAHPENGMMYVVNEEAGRVGLDCSP